MKERKKSTTQTYIASRCGIDWSASEHVRERASVILQFSLLLFMVVEREREREREREMVSHARHIRGHYIGASSYFMA